MFSPLFQEPGLMQEQRPSEGFVQTHFMQEPLHQRGKSGERWSGEDTCCWERWWRKCQANTGDRQMKVIFYMKEGNSLSPEASLFAFMRSWKTATVFLTLPVRKLGSILCLIWVFLLSLDIWQLAFFPYKKIENHPKWGNCALYDLASNSFGEVGRN
jgi:hypothetical protein